MGKKVTLRESELIEIIQKLIEEQEAASEVGEQAWLPFSKTWRKNRKRKKETKKLLKKGQQTDDETAFDAIDPDDKGDKKREENVRSGSINTLLNDLVTAVPPAFYYKLEIDNAKLSSRSEYKEIDKETKKPTGKLNYIAVMEKEVMDPLYVMYAAVSAIAYFISSSKKCSERKMPENAEARSMKGLTSLDAYIEKLEMYAKYLKGTLPGFIKTFLNSYEDARDLVEKYGKEYFNDKNVRGAEGIFSNWQDNFDRVAVQKKAFKTAENIVTGGESQKDPCHWDFD